MADRLSASQRHNPLIDALGESVESHSDVEEIPFEVRLKSPLPPKVRFYIFPLVDSGSVRKNEYKINVRLPGHSDGDPPMAPNRSGSHLVVLAGYHEKSDIFVFWDDDLYDAYSWAQTIQVKENTLETAASEGIATQYRGAGSGGMTVIAARRDHLETAIRMRDRLTQIRALLHEHLPNGWRDSSKQAQQIERVVDIFLEGTDSDQPTHERRREAQERVADDQDVKIQTIQEKTGGKLWGNKESSGQDYQREYFDPVLERIERAWIEMKHRTDSSSVDIPLLEKDVNHPLLDTIENNQTSISVYKFAAPPDYWLTSVEYNAISFGRRHENRWERLSTGDIVLFHSRAEPSNTDIPAQPAGLIGAAIIGETYEKDSDWWWNEHEANTELPLVAGFKRVFYTGRIELLNLGTEITEKTKSTIEEEIEALTHDLLEISEVNEICRAVSGVSFPAQQMCIEFTNEDGSLEIDRPKALIKALTLSLQEAPPINIYKEFSDTIDHGVLDGLHFPNDEGVEILNQIEAALRAGEHIVLTGPPGTGKTAIANRVADALASDFPWQFSDSQVTTATADWSTFDTVGGYMPNERADTDTQLAFSAGIILNRFKDQRTSTQRNELVVIDELNRADIDKAFGQLFTVLSGQSVQLPYTRDSNEIEIVTADSLDHLPKNHQYVVPASWSIFATMNTYDKTSLYEMSYAFMRRFSFIPVGVPALPSQGDPNEDEQLTELMASYVASWNGIDPSRDEQLAVARVWRNTNNAVEERAIGPAIVKDILSNIIQYSTSEIEPRLTNATISYIFPQLEGIPQRGQIVRNIAKAPDVNEEKLRTAAKEILQIPFSDDE